ncbi:hypothetical protein [Pontibacter ramchanderi]|uniref:Uncharacterized protein n=1 Tax=Pontibacter ramchanderi TaxID=1179743 RepID=A0A2N3V274_9BACT|nr:hypothetical protein [Pontibacter ramchanderi]PKV75720.1 hypothetical protein BD749_0666 [Pontibacter ramchanderi]
MFSLRVTLVLIVILIIPYAIKSFFSIEPFPAVILPSGPGKSLVNKSQFEVTTVSYLGKSGDGRWRQVNAQRLLHPLHYPLQRYILSREFMIGDSSNINYINYPTNILKSKLSRNRNNYQARSDLKELLKHRLYSQGFKSSSLKILKYKVIISIPGGDTINSILINESILYLDR